MDGADLFTVKKKFPIGSSRMIASFPNLASANAASSSHDLMELERERDQFDCSVTHLPSQPLSAPRHHAKVLLASRVPLLSSAYGHSYDLALTRLLRTRTSASTYDAHWLTIDTGQSPHNLTLRRKAVMIEVV
ncbi:uncharacterized protein STEHIDRAFT_173067 [Stereum hirsutum FP-91666 SS1]|uniref:Uncharacterized protein n=1 Tax=Stereum hirsutum (strain FP-91666) TaxID=721885 RepID=R7RXH1_STEHR|nr:uncharacterized protein STEHIDRAFT_173067 [Stereum hirsutum FP-91666 SS1]EIM79570.1 hypothetical protein STEHIDRAFT_173067 [Stereum hirsutum FP-91666 SS1]